MVLVHSDGNDLEVINNYGILDVLADIKQQGLIRAFGMPTKTVGGGLLAAEKSDCEMVTHNLAYREEEAVIEYCRKHGKAVLLKKALASGHIVSKNDEIDSVQAMYSKQYHPSILSIFSTHKHLTYKYYPSG